MQRTSPIVIVVSAAVVAVAIIVAAYFFIQGGDDADSREVACIQSGGHWDELNEFCVRL